MLAKQRQAAILEEVRHHGGVRVSDLTELLQVSDMTIRAGLAYRRLGRADQIDHRLFSGYLLGVFRRPR